MFLSGKDEIVVKDSNINPGDEALRIQMQTARRVFHKDDIKQVEDERDEAEKAEASIQHKAL